MSRRLAPGQAHACGCGLSLDQRTHPRFAAEAAPTVALQVGLGRLHAQEQLGGDRAVRLALGYQLGELAFAVGEAGDARAVTRLGPASPGPHPQAAQLPVGLALMVEGAHHAEALGALAHLGDRRIALPCSGQRAASQELGERRLEIPLPIAWQAGITSITERSPDGSAGPP